LIPTTLKKFYQNFHVVITQMEIRPGLGIGVAEMKDQKAMPEKQK